MSPATASTPGQVPVTALPATAPGAVSATSAEDELTAVDAVVAAVLGVPGVAGLSAGPAGSAATLLPGRRIDGVALRPTGTEVHVAVTYGSDVRATARAVHDAVTRVAAGVPQPVNVHVEDVQAR